MGLLLALLPALCWGSLVLLSTKLGGDSRSQLLGTAWGAFLFSIVMYIYKTPDLSWFIFFIGFISGMFWSLGQGNQYGSVEHLGVSKTVPLSTGMQLVATTAFGVFIFKEWETQTATFIGCIAIALIIIGVLFTVKEEHKNKSGDRKKGLLLLVVSTVGFLAYVVIIRWFEIDGWSAILPQGVGMVTGALLFSIKHRPFNKYALRNVITGAVWGIGNLGLLLAIPRIGVATSFSLSQTGIIISTLGGIFILGEKKSKKQMVFVIIGCLLIIAGGVMLGFTKT
ncbi:GRP family sugar transporter [Ectobacillus sp. JY-23]|uniref:GRP family sugar transporter n=1 Tax=Ectobacillus sp. JY-23 TaxID=2933872 RepID=UPI001FF2DAC5|nr:GRP family sugar transporter [Ectobacillus sp. JY-23]UOY93242.1 GRP family sugar transporter [Ectobacillus sp. JY-23]